MSCQPSPMFKMFSGTKFENIQDDLLKIELLKKLGCVTGAGEAGQLSPATVSAFSTLKRLITSQAPAPAPAKQLSTFLPALLPHLQPAPGPAPATPPFLPLFPPLEVELTEEAEQEPGEEAGLGAGLGGGGDQDHIPSTITSLSPRWVPASHLPQPQPRVQAGAQLLLRGRGAWQAGPGVRQLRRHGHAPLAAGRGGQLPVQRVRPLLQDERHQPAAGQAQELPRGKRGAALCCCCYCCCCCCRAPAGARG